MSDTIDRRENTIHFERTLEAPPEEVFDAWTKPEEIALWWDPSGAPLVACTIDLKPNGRFRFETAAHAPPFEGTYKVIERPNRLEFEAMGATGIVMLRPDGKGTRMNVAIRCSSAEHLETFVKLGVQAGTSATLDNLVGLVRTRTYAN